MTPARYLLARAICSRLPPIVAQRTRDVIYPLSAARRDDFRFTVNVATGSAFTGSSADMVAYPVAVHGYFNWRNVAIAMAVCKRGDAILEVGANIGSETVAFSDIVGATGAVYAVEPVPSNVELLRVNANSSRHRNITVLPIALSEEEGELSFVAPPGDNSGVGHVVRGTETSTTAPEVMSVPARTLDSLRDELRPPRLIIVDAEGHEGAVLRGGRAVLAEHRPILVLEVLDELLGPQDSSAREIAEMLRELDYVPFQISRFRIDEIPPSRETVPTASDWLALPASEVDLIRTIRRVVQRSAFAPCVNGLSPLKANAR